MSIWEDDKTEKGPSDNGGNIKRPGIWSVQPVSALLFVGGAVVLLAIIQKGVKEKILWSIPLVMWFAGIGAALKPWKKFMAGKQRRDEEIATTLDQLDPMANA